MTTTEINSWQMSSPTIIPSDNPNIKKGLYVSLACTHCRANHRRCNGEAPCSRCTKLNLECIYTKTRPRGGLRVKKNTKDNNQVECTNAVSCSESGIVLVDPTINFKMLLNFYTGIYNQTADYRMCPIALPNPDNLSAPEHKLRVLSCIGYAALTLGHRAQGQLFVEQAKQYVPQAMSSVTLEAALGFYHLGLSHLMDQDNATGVNYLKVCKSITSTVYNTQRSQGKADLFVTGPYEAKPTLQSVVLKLLYYYAVITAPMSFKSVQKKLNSLTKLTNKIGLFHEVLNLTSIIINIRFFGTEEEVLTALNSAETLASNPSDILMHTALLYTHMFRAMKFAFLQDYLAMNEECDRFISLFKSLQVHDLTTTKVAWLATYLWSSFDVPNFKIQELVTHAHQLSVNFPGYKALSTQHTKYQDPLGMLLERRLTCSEESMMPSNVVDPFANADVPLLDDSFIFDELLEVAKRSTPNSRTTQMNTTVPAENKIKRLYVALACSHCRTNHRRCNGEDPCSRCTKLNLKCIYEKTKPRGGYRVKKNQNNIQKEPETVCSAGLENATLPNSMNAVNVLLDFYTTTYYQTLDFRLCPLLLPKPNHLSGVEQKFRVLSSVGYAALTLGHVDQGHLFMDQAKQYLPQAMSSITMDAALGFYHLGISHLMDQDNESGVNYLKVCKSLASTIYNTQRSQGKVDVLVTGLYESQPIPQSIVLKLRHYYAMLMVQASVNEQQKRLNSLAKITEKWVALPRLFTITKTLINLRFCVTEEELLNALDFVEESARTFSTSLGHISLLYIPMFRAMKFAFLGDYSTMHVECDHSISVFKSLQVHDLTTIKVADVLTYLWITFDIPSGRIRELVTHAQQLSVNFPAYRTLSVKHNKYQDPLDSLVQRCLSFEESSSNTNVANSFTNTDVPPVLQNNFILDELGVTF